MCELFADIPEALANSVEIAKRCNVTVRLGEYFLPQFPTGDMTTEDFLVMKSKEGLEERLNSLPDPGSVREAPAGIRRASGYRAAGDQTRWASRLLS